MSAITKQNLVEQIARSTGISQADTRLVTETFLSTVSDFLVKGKTMELRGFGTFLVKIRKARPARNPRTGETVQLKMRTVPLLKFSAEVKKRVGHPKTKKAPTRREDEVGAVGFPSDES